MFQSKSLVNLKNQLFVLEKGQAFKSFKRKSKTLSKALEDFVPNLDKSGYIPDVEATDDDIQYFKRRKMFQSSS